MQGKVGWLASASVPAFEIAAAFPTALANPGFGNFRVAACLCFQTFQDIPCHVTRKSVSALLLARLSVFLCTENTETCDTGKHLNVREG
jgi:hypothetical protein